MPVILSFASGKGGVGKSVLAANLAYQLATKGKTVVLVDLDWGASNAHTLLGILNTNPGVGLFMVEKERSLADLRIATRTPGLSFIPGDGTVAPAANLPLVRKQKLLKKLSLLEADYVVLDLAAGSHLNTVDAYLASGLGFLVASPEPTSILNAYGFAKTALYRLLTQAAGPKTEARARLSAYFTGRDSGAAPGLDHLVAAATVENPALGEKLRSARARLRPRVVLNLVQDPAERTHGARLRQVCEKQLGLAVEYGALVPWDPAVRSSVIERRLLSEFHPDAPLARETGTLAEKILAGAFVGEPPFGTFADLEALAAREQDLTAGAGRGSATSLS